MSIVSSENAVSILCESMLAERAQYAKVLMQRIAVQRLQSLGIKSDQMSEYQLVVTDDHLELRTNNKSFKPVWVDFLNPKLTYRFSKGGGLKQMLARAVGIKGSYKLNVLDATAGLGIDAFVLAKLGCAVMCLERSPIVAALLQDGLDRFFEAQQSTPLALTLVQQDAHSYLEHLEHTNAYDVIYLDPMFPEKTKNALSKKEMQIFRALVGSDEDAPQLLALSLKHAKNRVVVKRPRLAPTLGDSVPDLVFEGKSSRFDVYLTHLQSNNLRKCML